MACLCTLPVISPALAGDDDPADWYSSRYENPFDKPKDRGPYYERKLRAEDRVKTIQPRRGYNIFEPGRKQKSAGESISELLHPPER